MYRWFKIVEGKTEKCIFKSKMTVMYVANRENKLDKMFEPFILFYNPN